MPPGTHLHPKDVPGAILSIDAMDPPSEWQWAGPNWHDHVRTETATALTGATIEAPAPSELAERWAEVLRQVVVREEGAYAIELEGTRVRFIPSRSGNAEGMCGVDVAVRDPAAPVARAKDRGLPCGTGWVELCGVRFDLVPA
ncbi:MAG: hypothetical protein U5Q44_00575 [Dehalococcoidia bacterium]|nr:hypothetical protein [Dehalococcoidia bacterium]